MKIFVYLDESGSIHKNSPTNYFVIGGYIAFGEPNQVHKIISKYKKINKRHKERRGIPLSRELKTREMTVQEKKEVLNGIQVLDNFYGCAIQFNKSNMRKEIEKTNIFFNFGVKLLFHDVILQLLPNNEPFEFVLAVDNRNISVDDLKDLQKYLETEFCYNDYSFSVKYYDSATHYGIQLADFVVNTMYMRSKDIDVVRDVVEAIDPSKFRLGVFPGKGKRGRMDKIDLSASIDKR